MDRSAVPAGAPAEVLGGPQPGDAFGALLLQCWEHGVEAGQVLEFVERDDGYLAAADAARYFAAPAAWDRLHTWAGTQVQGRVLSILVGTGVRLIPGRRKSMRLHAWSVDALELREHRHTIETVNSHAEAMDIDRLHARTNAGVELKVHASLVALHCWNAN